MRKERGVGAVVILALQYKLVPQEVKRTWAQEMRVRTDYQIEQ
jgi:hypothetical protein